MAGSLYFWEMLLPALGLCLPLNRREKSLWKAVTCMITSVVLLTVIMKLAQTKYEGTLISMGENIMFSMMMLGWFLVIWSLVIGCIYFFVQCSLREAMYIFALSYGVEHIFYCIRLLTEWLTGGRIGNTDPLIYLPCMVGSFLLAYFWFAKGAAYQGTYLLEGISASTSSIVLIAVVWGLSIVAGELNYAHIHSIYAIPCCIFMLSSQREQLRREIERTEFTKKEQLWQKTKLRYEMSKESMAVVNQHYHDMKHQLMALSTMSDEDKRKAKLLDMESRIAAYEAVVKTGNEILDTVLTEKKLTCQINHIAFSCIADGAQLSFMDELDIYTLFGNALDNAIEANRKIENAKNRWISVQIQRKKGIILIELINPYQGTVAFDESRMPVTSKADRESHGFGTKSIRSIIEKYDGQMIIKTEEQKYLIRMIFQGKD